MNVLKFCATLFLCQLIVMPAAQGSQETTARKWLSESERISASITPSGVYNQFEVARLSLSQSMSYAMLADMESTYTHLLFPPESDKQPEWLSGGDGMVRQLLIGLEFLEIHRTLISHLVANGKTEDAFTYVSKLTEQQGRRGIYLDLGTAIGNPELIHPTLTDNLPAQEKAELQLGLVLGLLEKQQDQQAERLLESIDPEQRTKTLQSLVPLLAMDGRWSDLSGLLGLAVKGGYANGRMMQDAVSMSTRAGDLDAANSLLKTIGKSIDLDPLNAQLAMRYSAAGDTVRAREIFRQSSTHKSRSWEQVAMQIEEDKWLENYYLATQDPWRRSERLFQFAKRRLTAGDRVHADHLAGLAKKAASEITSSSTQSLAYRLLAEFYALAGNPAATKKMRDQVTEPQPSKNRVQATIEMARAWAIAGDLQQALETANSINDPLSRVSALTVTAGVFAKTNTSHYATLLSAARAACGDVPPGQTQKTAWQSIVQMQLAHNDINGAKVTGSAAPDAKTAAVVYAIIVTHQLKVGDIEKAYETGQLIPVEQVASFDRTQRDQSLAEVVAAMAAAGQGMRAARVLNEVQHDVVRELNTPTVASALVAEGNTTAATQLVKDLKRNDSRQNTLAVVLYAMAKQQTLPTPELLEYVPKRRGGGLCWAAAAASGSDIKSLELWLREIKHPSCQAFAYAGAAYTLVAPREHRLPSHVFGFVDPQHTSERMAKAMQRQSAFR